MMRAAFGVLGLVIVGLAGCSGGGGHAASTPVGPPQLADVRGEYILVLSDVDMEATAFATAELGERDPSITDQVTIFTLPILEREEGTPWAQIAVSNSAVGPPVAAALSPDGRAAFVVESRKPAPEGATSFGDLPKGERLTAIDLSSPLEPSNAGILNVGPEPLSVDVHPDGDLVAVVRRSPDGENIVIAPVRDGFLEADALTWPVLGTGEPAGAPSAIAWHPSGRYLAVTMPTRNQVAFYEFSRTGDTGQWSLAPWGEPVAVGKYPYSGAFTPNGRFFITTDLHWGPDVEGFSVGAPAGSLSVIRLSDVASGVYPEGEAPIDVDHAVVSTVSVGISPEGLAISPDGRFVVTANLGRSYLPEGDERLGGGSLSLLEMDPATGALYSAGEYPVNGMPEGLCFDTSGRMVVVAQFRSLEIGVQDGELAFWRLDPSGPSLQQGDFYLSVGRGPHDVLIAR